jgi:hypothetical protein
MMLQTGKIVESGLVFHGKDTSEYIIWKMPNKAPLWAAVKRAHGTFRTSGLANRREAMEWVWQTCYKTCL